MINGEPTREIALLIADAMPALLDGTEVKTYLNGRLAHTETNIGIVYATGSYAVTIGGADDRPDYFKGVLDEVQLFQNGLNAAQVEQLFLSGNAGACVPYSTW